MAAACLALWYIPSQLVQVAESQVQHDPHFEYATLVDKYRSTLAQILGGIALLGGLYYTARNVLATEQSILTKTFSDAVGQLSIIDKNDQPNIPMRLGGIYTLSRIARLLSSDAQVVRSILTNYIQEESAHRLKYSEETHKVPSLVDIEAAISMLTTITPRTWFRKRHMVHLERAFLTDLNLMGRTFKGFEFHSCVLANSRLMFSACQGVIFQSCEALGCDFSNAKLHKATFNNLKCSLTLCSIRAKRLHVLGCELNSSDFSDAILHRAHFSNSNLSECNFMGARLTNVVMSGCDLTDAIFDGASLSGSDLRYVNGLSMEQLLAARSRPNKDRVPSYLNNDGWPTSDQ
jgi:uncharacterized protein YjbI with pentapeptide repeats